MDSIAPGTGGSNDELSGQIVPFGKYKGRSVAELAADDSYREWVLSQPWVRERYVNFYQVLIHGGPPPQDSPEHNEMQARFLDDNWCLSLARLLPGLADHGLKDAVDQITAWRKRNLAANPQIAETCDLEPPEISDLQMENRGWDVTFRYRPALLVQTWECACEIRACGCWREAARLPDLSVSQWEEGWYKPSEPRKLWCPEPSEPRQPKREEYKDPDYPRYPGGYYPPQYPGPTAQQRYEQGLAVYERDLSDYRDLLASYPARLAKETARYEKDLAEYEKRLACYEDERHVALDHGAHRNTFRTGESWDNLVPLIAAELKPDLGDDYPNVLRQVNKYLTRRVSYGRGQYGDEPTCDAAFVVARRARFTSVTWDQVRQIFAKSGILLVSESSLGSGQPL